MPLCNVMLISHVLMLLGLIVCNPVFSGLTAYLKHFPALMAGFLLHI